MNPAQLAFLELAIRSQDNHCRFFPTDSVPWIAEVEHYWPSIRQEVDCLLLALKDLPGFEQIQREQEVLTQDQRWRVFPFLAYGYEIDTNLRRCPSTAAALRKIPGLKTAMFSILEPGKEIPPHRGPYAGVLRYHLAVKVSRSEACGINVGGEDMTWQEGKSLLFDDSYEHFAWNRSDEDRVVLFVDIERPLPSRLASLNRKAIDSIGVSEFVQAAIKNWTAWESIHGSNLDAAMQPIRAE